MRGVTRYAADRALEATISTHTPHAGRDGDFDLQAQIEAEFQLTRPMRGVT